METIKKEQLEESSKNKLHFSQLIQTKTVLKHLKHNPVGKGVGLGYARALIERSNSGDFYSLTTGLIFPGFSGRRDDKH